MYKRGLYFNYRKHKILKHALQHYIEDRKSQLNKQYDEKLEKDIAAEEAVLAEVRDNLARFPAVRG